MATTWPFTSLVRYIVPMEETPKLAAFPCSHCRAPLKVSPEMGGATCRHCGGWTGFDDEVRARLAAHIARLTTLDAHAAGYRAGAEIYNTHRRGCVPLALITMVGISAASILANYLDGPWAWTPMVGLAVLVLAGLAVKARFFPDNDDREPAAAQRRVLLAQAACRNCGGSVPVAENAPLVCPFCTAELIPTGTMEVIIEQAAAERVDVEAARFADEARQANSPRTLVIVLIVMGAGMAIFTIYCMVLQVRLWQQSGFPWE